MSLIAAGAAEFEQALSEAGLRGVRVRHHHRTGSTNDDARAWAAGADVSEDFIGLVIADEQTKGRGRGGNTWFSPAGSISMTLTFPGVEVARLAVLPLGVGQVVVSCLRDLGIDAFVKWPNDVQVNGLKVCGILCESSLLSGKARVFIGIGINVTDVSTTEGMRPLSAGSLQDQSGRVDRPVLVTHLVSRLLGLLREETKGSAIVDAWKAVAVPWWGESVSLIDGERERRVTLLDVNPEGQLVVRDEGGAIRSLVSGEVRQVRLLA